MVRLILVSGFLAFLSSFSWVSHPVGCCFVLLLGSLSLSFFAFLSIGFSWYLVLFCLVYVGGVYVLFIYASLYSPNLFVGLGYSLSVFVSFFIFYLFFFFKDFVSEVFLEESGHYLCSLGEGNGYCFFCLVLLVGFSVISMIFSSDDCFFR